MYDLPQVHLLFGFLGAGKTTLVKNLLSKLDPDIPTAVVVNEFGQVGIDGEIIQGKSIDTVELVSGCICCTLKGSLLNAIEELTEVKGAQRIIVEATGVADPDDMLDDFEDPEVIDKFDVAPIVTVVDTPNFNKIRSMLGEFYTSQVLNADILIMNKIDLADEDIIAEVTNHVRQINPEAHIHFTEHCDVDSAAIFSDSAIIHDSPEHSRHHHHEHDTMASVVVQPFDHLSTTQFKKTMHYIPDNVWRIKGHMLLDNEPVLIQYSSSGLDISASLPRDHYRMVVIGQDLDTNQVMSLFGTPLHAE